MTVSMIKATDFCATCARPCAPAAHFAADPTCTACAHDLAARDLFPSLTTPHDLFFNLRDFSDLLFATD